MLLVWGHPSGHVPVLFLFQMPTSGLGQGKTRTTHSPDFFVCFLEEKNTINS